MPQDDRRNAKPDEPKRDREERPHPDPDTLEGPGKAHEASDDQDDEVTRRGER